MAGAVILVRHGEPALSRDVRLTASGYRDWWARYEDGGLKANQSPPAALIALTCDAAVIFASTRERSRQSALALAAGRPFTRDEVFIEAPLPPPPLPGWFRLSPRYWGVVARLCWWFFNLHDGQESRAEAEQRAEAAARQVVERAVGGDVVLVVAHGFFNFMIGRALRRLGWRRTFDNGYDHWSARRFEAPAG